MKGKTAAERRDHEQACLREVRRQISEDLLIKRDGTVIHRVDLEGEYPATSLVVDAEGRGRRRVLEWVLWDEGNGDFGTPGPDAMPADPSLVARDVMVQLYEF